MDTPTLLEGCLLVVAVLCLSPLYAWFWRERTPEPEPPVVPVPWRCQFWNRDGHVFVVVYRNDNISEAIVALGNVAVFSRTPMNLTDVANLADAMLADAEGMEARR